MQINKSKFFTKRFVFLIYVLMFYNISYCQLDTFRIQQISETVNQLLILNNYEYAFFPKHGENWNLDNTYYIKAALIDSFIEINYLFEEKKVKKYVFENYYTLTLNPDSKRNSYTWQFNKTTGTLEKEFGGGYCSIYRYNKKGELIQFGVGDFQRNVEINDSSYIWYWSKDHVFAFENMYDNNERIIYSKRSGVMNHIYSIYKNQWYRKLLVKTTEEKYHIDTTVPDIYETSFIYNVLNLISKVKFVNYKKQCFIKEENRYLINQDSSNALYEYNISILPDNILEISVIKNEKIILSTQFDKYNNLIFTDLGYTKIERKIYYNKKAEKN